MPPDLSRVQQVEQPFRVFISSSQSEFEQFRQDLKVNIDEESWSTLRPMRGVLIENQRGPVIPAEIRRGIDECSIYVGVFGRAWSDWAVSEFKYARMRGLPLLIYRIARRAARHSGRRSKVDEFLNREAKPLGYRIRGPYKTLERLEAEIMTDLVIQVAEMVKESAQVRKLINTGL